jgi:hypothetical protein
MNSYLCMCIGRVHTFAADSNSAYVFSTAIAPLTLVQVQVTWPAVH